MFLGVHMLNFEGHAKVCRTRVRCTQKKCCSQTRVLGHNMIVNLHVS